MNIETLGSIGDFISGVGVIVTLIYLAMQIRQNTMATKADSYQAVVTSTAEWSREISLNEEMCDILNRGAVDYASLNGVERTRFNLAMSSYFRNMENLHQKFITGAVDASLWTGWANRTHAFINSPGTRAWWELNASAFSADFGAFIAAPAEHTELPEALAYSQET